MGEAFRSLMSGLIDYAGLFPPAALELRNGPRFHAEPLTSPLRCVPAVQQALDGHRPIQPCVETQVHRPHASAPKQ